MDQVHCVTPLIDVNNPLYCPTISATSYLDSIRRQLSLARTRRPRLSIQRNIHLSYSFAEVLLQAFKDENDTLGTLDLFRNASFEHSSFPRIHLGTTTSSPSSDETLQPEVDQQFSVSIPSWERSDRHDIWNATLQDIESNGNTAGSKRKREDFSDFGGSSKYARSMQSVHDSSFEIKLKRERLRYSTRRPGTPFYRNPANNARQDDFKIKGEILDSKHRILELEERLYGPPIGTESPRHIRALIAILDSRLPGIRIKERLSQLPDPSHQSIVDFLGTNGYINSRTLILFRTSEIHWMTLTESLMDANGLNLCGDILPIFNQPNSFLFLSELSLRDIQLHDFDLINIQRLPKLSTLLLDNTSISNEAVFLLVPLKRSLKQLSIGSNWKINDEAVPALLLLSELSFLCLRDTNINVPGIRRLGKVIYEEDRMVDIEIPTVCEEYFDGIHKKYLLDPRLPLVTDPAICSQLSAAALQRNLAAHAAVNPEIYAGGGKAEMAGRLRKLLETRRIDMLIRGMILGSGD